MKTRKSFVWAGVFMLLLACFVQAVSAEEDSGLPNLEVSNPSYYAAGYDFPAVGTPFGVKFDITNIGDFPYDGYLTVWCSSPRYYSPTLSLDNNNIVTMTGYKYIAPGQTVSVAIANYKDWGRFTQSGEDYLNFGVTDLASEKDEANNEGVFNFFVEPSVDLRLGVGIWNYGKTIRIEPHTSGEIYPEGPFIYSIFVNGQSVYEGESFENRLTLDIRDKIIAETNTYSVRVLKKAVFDPDLKNNLVEGSFYLRKGSIAQDIGIDASYEKDSDVLTVCPSAVSGDTFVPKLFHVDVLANSEKLFESDFDSSQGCILYDFSSHLNPGSNEVSVEISYIDQSPFYDPDTKNNRYCFSVLVPATYISVSSLKFEKIGSQGGAVSFDIEGDSTIAEEIAVKIYDKKGKIIYTENLYNVNLPHKFFSSDFRWSDISGGAKVEACLV